VSGRDLLLVSLGTTRGWQVADAGFLELAEAAGASAEAVSVRRGLTDRLRRGYPVNDAVEALAARRAVRAALRERRPRSLVLSTVTTSLALPELEIPYAVRLDTPAALNRAGLRNAPVRAAERRALRRARLLLPWSSAAAEALPPGAAPAVVLPPPVEPSGALDGATRERLAVAYTPNPQTKGLDILCRAWAEARLEGARLAVFGIDPARGAAHLARAGVPEPAGLEWRGMASGTEFRAALRGAWAMVAAARWEDFGQAPLEALAEGALLVTGPSAGALEALGPARALAPELVARDLSPGALAGCLHRAFAFDERRADEYRRAARERLLPYGREALAATLRQRVLPALVGGS
jgi:Glycosyl transferases group 1